MQPTRFEIPEQMRTAAEETVGQARRVVEQFLDATEKAVASAEGSASAVGEGAADLSRQSLAFVEENIAASFDLAERLVRVRTLEEVAALQQEFLRRQMSVVAEQGKTLAAMAAQVAGKPGTHPTRK